MNANSDTVSPKPMKPIETVHTDSPIVTCEGNSPVFGHPRVYLKLQDGQVTCPYCSKFFILTPAT